MPAAWLSSELGLITSGSNSERATSRCHPKAISEVGVGGWGGANCLEMDVVLLPIYVQDERSVPDS